MIKFNYTNSQTSSVHIMPFTILLLISTFLHLSHMAQGRHFIEYNRDDVIKNSNEKKGSMKVMGSKPPRCMKSCVSCGHCEAVQIPIIPSIKKTFQIQQIPRISYSRGDDISNYKPMCWKCKCGDFYFNPW